MSRKGRLGTLRSRIGFRFSWNLHNVHSMAYFLFCEGCFNVFSSPPSVGRCSNMLGNLSLVRKFLRCIACCFILFWERNQKKTYHLWTYPIHLLSLAKHHHQHVFCWGQAPCQMILLGRRMPTFWKFFFSVDLWGSLPVCLETKKNERDRLLVAMTLEFLGRVFLSSQKPLGPYLPVN